MEAIVRVVVIRAMGVKSRIERAPTYDVELLHLLRDVQIRFPMGHRRRLFAQLAAKL